jgi:hypothetical protein
MAADVSMLDECRSRQREFGETNEQFSVMNVIYLNNARLI